MTATDVLPLSPPRSTDNFRPIQYLGSKWRLLDQIQSQVDRLRDPRRPVVCDLFAGTGVVTRHLAGLGPVQASDVQEYSRVLTSALVAPVALPGHEPAVLVHRARGELATHLGPALQRLIAYEAAVHTSRDATQVSDLVERGSIAATAWTVAARAQYSTLDELVAAAAAEVVDGSRSAMVRYYGGVYFSYKQAAELDALASTIRALPEVERDTALAALLSTTSELVASVGGHFAQPMRMRSSTGAVKPALVASLIRSRRQSTFPAFEAWLHRYQDRRAVPHPVQVSRGDYRSTLASLPDDVGLVYADPPYTRDHYSRFYHVLETLALGDDPGLSTVRTGGREQPSRGLYRRDRHQSPFCIVSEAPRAFDELCIPLRARRIPLIVSYSPVPKTDKPRARVVLLDDLRARLASHFDSVDVVDIVGVGHAKLNVDRLNAAKTYDAEVLLVCRP